MSEVGQARRSCLGQPLSAFPELFRKPTSVDDLAVTDALRAEYTLGSRSTAVTALIRLGVAAKADDDAAD